jgi:hypothetical protein
MDLSMMRYTMVEFFGCLLWLINGVAGVRCWRWRKVCPAVRSQNHRGLDRVIAKHGKPKSITVDGAEFTSRALD